MILELPLSNVVYPCLRRAFLQCPRVLGMSLLRELPSGKQGSFGCAQHRVCSVYPQICISSTRITQEGTRLHKASCAELPRIHFFLRDVGFPGVLKQRTQKLKGVAQLLDCVAPPAPFPTQIGLRCVSSCRLDEGSSRTRPWGADSGQTLGGPLCAHFEPICPALDGGPLE